MAEVKGVLLNAVLSFLGERFGEEALDKAIANLSPSDRVLLPTVILASNWYAYSAWGPVRRLTAALSQGKDPDLGIEMGKFNASYVFGGVYKSLLIKDPAKLVKKFSWMHDFFYRDGLSLETELPGEGGCWLRYRYADDAKPARSTCISTMGFWIRTIELAGGSNVTAQHTKCRAQGYELCEYRIEWE
ncbi:MAG TPA: hypothetical protein VKM94_13360 [Blastocatellia bacterium]|nr:hypothetical protein [Blastocatellia bacterium]